MINFEITDVLHANAHYHSIRHEINDGHKTGKSLQMLRDFLHNCPAQQLTEEFDVVISYMDMGEQKQKNAIMRFDLNTKKLTVNYN